MSRTREHLIIGSSIICFFLLIFIGGGIGYIVDRTFHESLFEVVGVTLGFMVGGILRFMTHDYSYEKKAAEEDLLD